MTKLSPAAQAVITASNCAGSRIVQLHIAAALRAAVDEVISSVPPPCEDYDEYAQGFLAAHVKYRNQILAIADELEAQ